MDKNDLISRSVAMEIVKRTSGDYAAAWIEIERLPAIDPEELRPKGKWIWNPDGVDWGLGAWVCSECACRNNNLPMDSNINPLTFSGSKYCPNCGAMMMED